MNRSRFQLHDESLRFMVVSMPQLETHEDSLNQLIVCLLQLNMKLLLG